jgi:hypothetical protein
MLLWEIIAVHYEKYEKGYNVEFCTNNAAGTSSNHCVCVWGGGVEFESLKCLLP